MKNCITLLDIVNREISEINIQRSKQECSIIKDFNYSFEWGYCESLYALNYKRLKLINIVDAINHETDSNTIIKYLKSIIESINSNIKRGCFTGHSTSIYSNIAHTLKLEVDVKFISDCERYIKYLTDDEPMQLK